MIPDFIPYGTVQVERWPDEKRPYSVEVREVHGWRVVGRYRTEQDAETVAAMVESKPLDDRSIPLQSGLTTF